MWLISISNAYLDKNSFRYSFSALVWLHLDYCVSILPKKKNLLSVTRKIFTQAAAFLFHQCFLKLRLYILIHIRLCERVTDKNVFKKPISGKKTTLFLGLWYPLLNVDEELNENVLRRESKLITRISIFLYPDRLRSVDIPSMKYRRIRGDMIQVFKILHGEDILLKVLCKVDSTSITRMHKFKLKKPLAKNKVHKHFFSIWVVNDWNSLPPGVVNAVSLDSLKTKLHKIWSDKQYKF